MNAPLMLEHMNAPDDVGAHKMPLMLEHIKCH